MAIEHAAIGLQPRLSDITCSRTSMVCIESLSYRDNFCKLADTDVSGPKQIKAACDTCKKCKCDSRLAVLASSMPFLPELEEFELRESSLDFGSATNFFTLLEPLQSLKTLRVTGPNPWLLHCGRLALCEAAATLRLETLDLANNGWNIVGTSLLPLIRLPTLKQVLLHGSVLQPSPLLTPIHGLLKGYTNP